MCLCSYSIKNQLFPAVKVIYIIDKIVFLINLMLLSLKKKKVTFKNMAISKSFQKTKKQKKKAQWNGSIHYKLLKQIQRYLCSGKELLKLKNNVHILQLLYVYEVSQNSRWNSVYMEVLRSPRPSTWAFVVICVFISIFAYCSRLLGHPWKRTYFPQFFRFP